VVHYEKGYSFQCNTHMRYYWPVTVVQYCSRLPAKIATKDKLCWS